VKQAIIGRAQWFLSEAGEMFAIGLEATRKSWDVKLWWREFVEQVWFIASVATLPVLLMAIPIAATIALQVGDLTAQLGAEAATGAAVSLGVIREAAPIVTALLIAGAGGTAMSADMGSRNIREELDALQVMGINPIHRLVTPRLWAGAVVGTLLVGFVVVAGVGSAFVFNVLFQGVSPGAYWQSWTMLLQTPDLVVSLLKAFIFGYIASVVACYKGVTCAKGPIGVGSAVMHAVVITLVLLVTINLFITNLYFLLVPQKL
jgi:phospholipid/cholesterol/gamma-HCH transport system permease protein